MNRIASTSKIVIFAASLLWELVAAPRVFAASDKSVAAGETWIIDQTTQLDSLSIAEDAAIKTAEGYSLSLIVDGVERDLKPGSYEGKISVVKTETNSVKFGAMPWAAGVIHPFRQAIYLDKTGLVKEKSVVQAAGRFELKGDTLTGGHIQSRGENFNGLYVAGGRYTVKGLKLNFEGNGANDFAGYGAGVMSAGKDVVLTVDGAEIHSKGVVRAALVADKGSKLIVRNSSISCHDGAQAPGYRPNTTPGEMKNVPWMLGLTGNCRTTNLLGDNTVAAYINSTITAEKWGVLSVDSSTNTKIYAINSKVAITGDSGYGTYAIGNSTNYFLGSNLTVPDYGAIVTGGNVVFASSSAENLIKVNAEGTFGFSSAELAAIKPAHTTVNSKRFAVMVWGNNGADKNTVKVMDASIIRSNEAFLVDRGAPVVVDVDGSRGAVIEAKNRIIIQVMDLDKAPGVPADGLNLTTGVYKESTLPVAKIADFDLTTAHASDVIANFAAITLNGDFYNGITTAAKGSSMGGGPPMAAPPAAGAPGGAAPAVGDTSSNLTGKNLVLNFDNANITGVISATLARHAKDTLTSADVLLVSEVSNTPKPAVNNGVIVNLKKSTWTVSGASYITALALDEVSQIVAADGGKATLTVDGVEMPIKAGSYKGAIVLNVK